MAKIKTFKLTIKLGNDAMQTPGDVARALAHVSNKLVRESEFNDCTRDGRVLDLNGNTVGEWRAR